MRVAELLILLDGQPAEAEVRAGAMHQADVEIFAGDWTLKENGWFLLLKLDEPPGEQRWNVTEAAE